MTRPATFGELRASGWTSRKVKDELRANTVRSANGLKNAGIRTLRELVQKTEKDMLETKNFGRKSLNEIKDILREKGLAFGMKLEAPTGAGR